MLKRHLTLSVVCSLIGLHPLVAQRGLARVRGVVFDSLRGKPLGNASVSIAGGRFAMNTDPSGRFEFDSVPPGTFVITARHALLDSIGLPGLSTKAVVTEDGGEGDINLSVPSFASMWRVACGDRRPPRDSGIVYGTIRDAESSRPIANASVEVSWSDFVLQQQKVRERRWRIDTKSNSAGGYAICGVPVDIATELHTRAESAESGVLDLPVGATRVQRRDLLIATNDTNARGRLRGTVIDHLGTTVTDAVIRVDSSSEGRTDSTGAFELTRVPAGTREVKVLAIGAEPMTIVADIMPRETTTLAVQLRPVYTLNTVTTTGTRGARVFASEFEVRRKSGFGYMQDSTTIARYPQFVNALRSFPSLNVQQRPTTLMITVPNGKGGDCQPDVLIDGARGTFNHLLDLMPNEIGGVEVYTHAAHIPSRFVPAGIQPQCGMILVWTKYGFRNR
ncbi:MAG TPA: carboxypeptidase regulatory-like domain-containing protein [Gemmatimonadaceae bacterium]|nr:carboxypeptidase regulatory-like domain-containing protein [Gemmatimonadaceae bacterium]